MRRAMQTQLFFHRPLLEHRVKINFPGSIIINKVDASIVALYLSSHSRGPIFRVYAYVLYIFITYNGV